MPSSWLLQPRPTAPPPLATTRARLPSFSFTQIQIADVLKELQTLDPNKSAEIDNLDPRFLKLSTAIVATPITSMFNLSFVSPEIPKDWKASLVIPLFKGGDTLDPNCYRPISTLLCLSKFFDIQVNKQITSNPTEPSPLCNLDFELVTGATSATLKVLNDIITAIDERPSKTVALCS